MTFTRYLWTGALVTGIHTLLLWTLSDTLGVVKANLLIVPTMFLLRYGLLKDLGNIISALVFLFLPFIALAEWIKGERNTDFLGRTIR